MRTLYKTLIWLSIAVFVGGIVGESNQWQLLSHGLRLAPILFVIGVAIWIALRSRNLIPHPYRPQDYKTAFDAAFAFFLNNFVVEFWGMIMGLAMLIVVLPLGSMKDTPGFQQAMVELAREQQVLDEIGEVTGIGYFVSGSTWSGHAQFSFNLYGTEGATYVDVTVEKEDNGVWVVTDLAFD